MSTIKLLSLAAAIALLVAFEATSQEPEQDAYKLVTYEVGDLVVTVPDYSAAGASQTTSTAPGMAGFSGGMGGGGFGRGHASFGGEAAAPGGSAASAVAPVTVPALIEAIRTMVAPGSWRPQLGAGGGMGPDGMGPGMMGMEGGMGMADPSGQAFGGQGEITSLGATLVIRQTKAAHHEIAELLESLRGGSVARRSVSIDARWLMLSSDDLEQLIPASEDVAEQPAVDRKALGEFTRRPDSLRGMTNCFSGQSVYLTSGTRRSSVSSYIPVVGSIELPAVTEALFAVHETNHRSGIKALENPSRLITLVADDQSFGGSSSGRSVGYQPVITTNNFGVELAIRPTLLQGEQAAVVDVKSTVTFPGQTADANAAADPSMGAPLAPAVDRIAIQTQEIATTVRVPLGQPVLVGGMTHLDRAGDLAPLDDPAAASSEKRQLYLILEVK
jgi:hypothetical protein